MAPRDKTSSSTLFGRRLREVRLRIPCTQEQLGIMIGLDEGTARSRISRYETGDIKSPRSAAKQVSDALQIPLAYFYCDDDLLARMVIAYWSLDETKRAEVLELVEQMAAAQPE
jgi:transcriptional regulator with XRE-family HTH domain